MRSGWLITAAAALVACGAPRPSDPQAEAAPEGAAPSPARVAIPDELKSFCRAPVPGSGTVPNVPVVDAPSVLANDDVRTEGSQIEVALRCVVRTPEEWSTLERFGTIQGAAIRPDDFTRSMFLLASMGRQPTTMHFIRVDSVLAHGDTLTAVVRQIHPEIAGDQQTYPIEIVRVPRRDGPVLFAER